MKEYIVNENGKNRLATPEEAKRIEAELAVPPAKMMNAERITALEIRAAEMEAALIGGI